MVDEENPSASGLTIAEELEASITDGQKISLALSSGEHRAESERIELDARRQFIKLRGKWSGNLKWWIGLLLLFHTGLAIGIGLKFLDFSNYQWFIRILILEDFLQIVGMGYIIIHFLYPGGLSGARRGNK